MVTVESKMPSFTPVLIRTLNMKEELRMPSCASSLCSVATRTIFSNSVTVDSESKSPRRALLE